jgi:hypothetical protein
MSVVQCESRVTGNRGSRSDSQVHGTLVIRSNKENEPLINQATKRDLTKAIQNWPSPIDDD